MKTYQEVWAFDKGLLKKYNQDFPIDWSGELPASEDAYQILLAQSDFWQRPSDPVEMSENAAKKSLERLALDVEQTWGAKFQEALEIEIVPVWNYLPRIVEVQREMNERIGYGKVAQSPPRMFYSPYHEKIIIPSRYVVRIPKNGNYPNYEEAAALIGGYDVADFPWSLSFFESTFTEEISHGLFRQLRGESKQGYLNLARSLPHKLYPISMLNETLAQHVKEIIAEGRPEWGLHVVAYKIGLVWQDRRMMDLYRTIDASSRTKTLGQIARLDKLNSKKQNRKPRIKAGNQKKS